MYSGVDNLRCMYDLHQTYFSLALDDLPLEELNPISANIKAMKKRESMHVTRFLSSLPSSCDSVCSQILGIKELPSLDEVFSRFR